MQVGDLDGELVVVAAGDARDGLALADYSEHDPLPAQRDGLVGLKDRATALIEGLAPTFTIEDVILEGDRVVVRWTNRGSMSALPRHCGQRSVVQHCRR